MSTSMKYKDIYKLRPMMGLHLETLFLDKTTTLLRLRAELLENNMSDINTEYLQSELEDGCISIKDLSIQPYNIGTYKEEGHYKLEIYSEVMLVGKTWKRLTKDQQEWFKSIAEYDKDHDLYTSEHFALSNNKLQQHKRLNYEEVRVCVKRVLNCMNYLVESKPVSKKK